MMMNMKKGHNSSHGEKNGDATHLYVFTCRKEFRHDAMGSLLKQLVGRTQRASEVSTLIEQVVLEEQAKCPH